MSGFYESKVTVHVINTINKQKPKKSLVLTENKTKTKKSRIFYLFFSATDSSSSME